MAVVAVAGGSVEAVAGGSVVAAAVGSVEVAAVFVAAVVFAVVTMEAGTTGARIGAQASTLDLGTHITGMDILHIMATTDTIRMHTTDTRRHQPRIINTNILSNKFSSSRKCSNSPRLLVLPTTRDKTII